MTTSAPPGYFGFGLRPARCRLALGYQSAEDEAAIVALRDRLWVTPRLIADGCRAHPGHPDPSRSPSGRLRPGSHRPCPRGPIALTRRCGRRRLRTSRPQTARPPRPLRPHRLDETTDTTPERSSPNCGRTTSTPRAAAGRARLGAASPRRNAVQLHGVEWRRSFCPDSKPLARKPKRLDEAPLPLPACGRAAPVVVEATT